MRLFLAANANRESYFFTFYLDANRLRHVTEELTVCRRSLSVFLYLLEQQIPIQLLRVKQSVADVYPGYRITRLSSRIENRLVMERVHVYDPAKIVLIVGFEPVEIPRLINLIAVDCRFALGFDFDSDIVFGQVLIGRYILVSHRISPAALLKHGLLNPDTEHMLVIADGGDFTSLSVFVKANDSKTSKSDKRSSRAFLNRHGVLLSSAVKKAFKLE